MTIPKFPVAMIETGFGELQAAQSLAQSDKNLLSPGVTDTDGLILPQPASERPSDSTNSARTLGTTTGYRRCGGISSQ